MKTALVRALFFTKGRGFRLFFVRYEIFRGIYEFAVFIGFEVQMCAVGVFYNHRIAYFTYLRTLFHSLRYRYAYVLG